MLIWYFTFSSVFREEFTFSLSSIIMVEPEFVKTFWQSVQLWQWAGFLVGAIFLISFAMWSCSEKTRFIWRLSMTFQGPTVCLTSLVTTLDRGRQFSSKSAGNTSLPGCHWSVWNPFLGSLNSIPNTARVCRYADDTQVYVSSQPNDATVSSFIQ